MQKNAFLNGHLLRIESISVSRTIGNLSAFLSRTQEVDFSKMISTQVGPLGQASQRISEKNTQT